MDGKESGGEWGRRARGDHSLQEEGGQAGETATQTGQRLWRLRTMGGANSFGPITCLCLPNWFRFPIACSGEFQRWKSKFGPQRFDDCCGLWRRWWRLGRLVLFRSSRKSGSCPDSGRRGSRSQLSFSRKFPFVKSTEKLNEFGSDGGEGECAGWGWGPHPLISNFVNSFAHFPSLPLHSMYGMYRKVSETKE